MTHDGRRAAPSPPAVPGAAAPSPPSGPAVPSPLCRPHLAAALLLAACSGGADAPVAPPPATCTFVNPIAVGADPWAVRHEGAYYHVAAGDRGIDVYKSDALTDPRRNGARIWTAPATGWNSTNVWAPELHFLDGRWYVYYAAGSGGPPFVSQRSGVLRSVGADPQGLYEDLGRLDTGGDVATRADDVWAIDLTVGTVNGRLYAVWSGWEENAATDRTPQHLYIATMSDPATISGARVRLSSPVESWERGTELDLQEGPTFLRNGEHVFLIYSTRESWLPDYRLGQLRLAGAAADPLQPASWTKSGPVLSRTTSVFGVGHASFTTSPDGTEPWMVYHAKTGTAPGWDRVVRAQPFTWSPDGAPACGAPAPTGQALPQPSGQCD